ncbi:hypothetical protein P4629_10520 [Priestia aryabhattai]|uniref:hypothetical protein n=1 Tax=Priestia aryabhattai TaxID=412384 RepID=UPI002E229B29|nr:hypothetical protein [Priestia aryabhattai]MED4005847.1 hypothetical protein [Priestia aryabhattai]
MSESTLGAPAAFRGYRLQTLYIINRILNAERDYIYCPEKEEDLSIMDEDKNFLEIIQIKAHASSNLKLSDFKISKPDSFFRRISKYKDEQKRPKIKILSFDTVGPELIGAFNDKKPIDQERVKKKLLDANYTTNEIEYFFNNISIELIDENTLKEQIFEDIEKISLACSVETTFDILNAWLYHCSEFSVEINLNDLIKKIYSIGDNANAQTQHKQHWGKTVTVLGGNEKKDMINKDAFVKGTFTTFNHIEENLDIKRERWLEQISEAHLKNHLVIIHGASGQGKTTLAYRYMKEYFAENFRFEITSKGLSSIDVILDIAHAIKGFASRIPEIPIGIYIDIPPRELKWLDILRELKDFSNIFLLITIREEDWQRSSGEVYGLSWEEIELSFSKEEAEKYYEEHIYKSPQLHHLDFNEAWIGFGGKGPLLEFAYYLNEGMQLKEKLIIQIKKIEEECSREQNYEKLELLKVITIASVYNSRVSLKKVIRCLDLKDITSIRYLENEYFIKIDAEDNVIEGLHYVRSLIIKDIIIDDVFNPFIRYVKHSLNSIIEEDYELFLKNLFYEKRNIDDILNFISNEELFSLSSWIGVKAVISSLLWLGVRDYVEENKGLIAEVSERFDYTTASLFILDFDVSNLLKEPSYQMLASLLGNSALDEIENYRKRQTPKNNVFKYLRKWISNINYIVSHPQSKEEWLALGFSSLWIKKAECKGYLKKAIEQMDTNRILELEYSIEEIAKIIVGIYTITPEKIQRFCEENSRFLLEKYQLQRNIIKIEQTPESIKFYKLFEMNNEKSIGRLVTEEIYILRELLPYKTYYISQIVGHKFVLDHLKENFDESYKKVSIDNILLKEYTELNRVAMALIRNQYRVDNWDQFISWYEKNQGILKGMIFSIKELLTNYFRKNNLKAFTTSVKAYSENLSRIGKTTRLLLPSNLIDKFGTVDEHLLLKESEIDEHLIREESEIATKRPEESNLLIPNIEKYKNLTKYWEDFRTNIENLTRDIEINICYNYIIKKNHLHKYKKEDFKKITDSKVDDRIILYNIRKALKNLIDFSHEFNKVFKEWFKEDIIVKLQDQEDLIQKLNIILAYYAGIIENQASNYYNLESAHKRDVTLFLNDLTRKVEVIPKEEDSCNFIKVQHYNIEENMLIVQFDLEKDVPKISKLLERIIIKISEAVRTIDQKTNLYLDIESKINRVIIIPSYRERVFRSFNYIIPFYVFSQEFNDINQVHWLPKVLNNQIKNELKIENEICTNLFDRYGEILNIMKYFNAIINGSSDSNKFSQKVVDRYLQKENCKEKLEDSFSQFFSELTQITSFICNKKELDSNLEIELLEKLMVVADYLENNFNEKIEMDDSSIDNIQSIANDILSIDLLATELGFN